MSRAFAPAESTQDQPGDKAARQDFAAWLREQHATKDRSIPLNQPAPSNRSTNQKAE